MSDPDQDMDTTINTEPKAAVSDLPAPGQILQKRREEMGLSHGRVADALHITAHYVKALESDDYEKLPGRTFVKGYFKSYAKLLGLDVDEVMQSYQQYNAVLVETEESEAKDIRAQRAYDQNLRWMICAAVIIILVVVASWWLSRDDNSAAEMAGFDNSAVAEISEDKISVNAEDNSPVTAEMLLASLEGTGQEAVVDIIEVEDVASELIAAPETAMAPVPDVPQGTGQQNPQANVLASDRPAQSPDFSPVIANESELHVEMQEKPLSGPPGFTVTSFDDHHQVSLESEGNDLLEVHFSGDSWIEVDDGENTRLYHDMLYTGDDLTIKGMGPFNILIGDANMVDMQFNSSEVNVLSSMRSDNSARITLQTETR